MVGRSVAGGAAGSRPGAGHLRMTSPSSAPHSRRVYRSVSTTRAGVASSVVAVGMCVLVVVPGGGRTLGFIGAPLFLLLTWRTWNVGIHVEADGVKVVAFLASRRVQWEDVDHFAVLPLGGYPFVGHVVLRDGRALGTTGLSAPARPKSNTEQFRLEVQRPIDELNQVLTERREGEQSTAGTSVPP